MKNILTRFYNTVEDTTKMLVEDSEYSPEIKRALKTEKTKTGVKVGQWELIVKMTESFGKKAKNYTIKHTTTGCIIAKDLVLYEAANLLLKYLSDCKIYKLFIPKSIPISNIFVALHFFINLLSAVYLFYKTKK